MLSDGARVCQHVAEGSAPILRAQRVKEGAAEEAEWRFSCGESGHKPGGDRLLALEEVVARDPTAIEIVMHPRGTGLERRNPLAPWHTEVGPLLFPLRPSRRYAHFEPRYPPRPGEPLDAEDLLILAEIAERGFHVVRSPSGAFPSLAHSIGLFRSFDHPEVCVLGEPPGGAGQAVESLAERVTKGERLDPDLVLDGAVPERAITLVSVSARQHPELLALAVWYYGGLRFPAVQAVWPDEAGRYPWERWANKEHREAQPILAERDPA